MKRSGPGISRVLVLAAVFLLPQYFTLWAREAKAVAGFSLPYWTLFLAVAVSLGPVCGAIILKQRSVRTLPLGWPLALLFLAPYVVSHVYGFAHVNEIPVELAFGGDGFGSLNAWYSAHLAMSLLTTVGLAMAVAIALERGLGLDDLLLAAALPLWPIVIHALVATAASGLGIGDLTSETNRHFLQYETNFGIHGNAFGQYGLFAYVCLLGAIAGTSQPLRRWFYIATAVLVSLGILVGFSRTAWGGWVVVTLFWSSGARGTKRLLVPAMLAMSVAMAPPELFQRVSKGLADGNVDEVLSGRLEHMWLPALEEVWRNPFFGQGWGAYMWSDVFQAGLVFQTATVHNAFIRLLMEAGIVGLVLVCGFYAVTWSEARRLELVETDPLTRSMLKSSRWLVVVMLLTGVTGDAITPEITQLYFWIGFGIFLARRQRREGWIPGRSRAPECRGVVRTPRLVLSRENPIVNLPGEA